VREKTIGVLGATFKPNTDDMREAASLTIVPLLIGKGAQVSIYDPQGRRHGQALLEGAKWCNSAFEAAKLADIVVVLTEWNEFRAIDLEELGRTMRGDLIVDTRNIYQPAQAHAAGLRYLGVGRPSEAVADATRPALRQRASG
jgi:UDPglucose 6-dehydrogenase